MWILIVVFLLAPSISFAGELFIPQAPNMLENMRKAEEIKQMQIQNEMMRRSLEEKKPIENKEEISEKEKISRSLDMYGKGFEAGYEKGYKSGYDKSSENCSAHDVAPAP